MASCLVKHRDNFIFHLYLFIHKHLCRQLFVAWQPFNAQSDHCCATVVNHEDIGQREYICKTVTINKQFMYLTRLYFKRTTGEESVFSLLGLCTAVNRLET